MKLEKIEKIKSIYELSEVNSYGLIKIKKILIKNKRELSTLYPIEFLDYNMLDTLLKNMKEEDKSQLIERLEDGFNGKTDLLFEILKNDINP